MEEKEMSQTEYNDYLIKIQSDKISKLEKDIEKKDNIYSIIIFVLFTPALLGCIYLIENWNMTLRETILFPLIIIIPLGILGSLVWISEKIKNQIWKK